MRYLMIDGDPRGYYQLNDNGTAWYFEFEPREEDGKRYGHQIKGVSSDTRFRTDLDVSVPLLSDEEKENIRERAESRPLVQIVLIVGKHLG